MTGNGAPAPLVGPKRAARAIDALRRGWPVTVAGPDASLTLVPVETAAQSPDGYDPKALLLSGSRAVTLKLANQISAADPARPVMIAAPENLDATLAMAIADPTLDMRYPMKGPFVSLPIPDMKAGEAAIELARHAGILPAFFVIENDASPDTDIVTPDDVAKFADAGTLYIAARARLPVEASENSEIIAFRSEADASDHVALIIGKPDATPPVIRLHSECLTGDILGSLKCDCGPQLQEALRQIAAGNWGILLYLRQEGRGIGLVNKLRAYMLQDQGFDTVDANTRLGFAIDARDFSVAANMLRLMGIDTVRLLTNNPQKVAGLEAENIKVAERLPIRIAANEHNQRYLDTKRDRTGHQL